MATYSRLAGLKVKASLVSKLPSKLWTFIPCVSTIVSVFSATEDAFLIFENLETEEMTEKVKGFMNF